jgi:hypothetical protein
LDGVTPNYIGNNFVCVFKPPSPFRTLQRLQRTDKIQSREKASFGGVNPAIREHTLLATPLI